MAKNLGAIVLAAGFSNRFGSLKLAAKLNNGNTIFAQTLERIRTAIPDYKVITRPEIAEQLRAIEPDLHVFNEAEKGMGSTLAHGITLANEWDCCLICLADMPFIEIATYQSISALLNESNIVVPTYSGEAGNPVGFGRRFFPELAQLSGEGGGKKILNKHQANVVTVESSDPAILYDIDTPAELEKHQNQFG